jgi:hypothetical protein
MSTQFDVNKHCVPNMVKLVMEDPFTGKALLSNRRELVSWSQTKVT